MLILGTWIVASSQFTQPLGRADDDRHPIDRSPRAGDGRMCEYRVHEDIKVSVLTGLPSHQRVDTPTAVDLIDGLYFPSANR